MSPDAAGGASAARGPLGLIAGNGQFPFLVADAARRQGRRVVAVGIREETFPDLASRVDALPYAKTVGNRPARNYGLNTIGLVRRRIPADAIAKLKQAYRYLLTSKLNTTRALAEIERDEALACPEVGHLIDFIRTSSRGVVLRRTLTRRADDAVVADE